MRLNAGAMNIFTSTWIINIMFTAANAIIGTHLIKINKCKKKSSNL